MEAQRSRSRSGSQYIPRIKLDEFEKLVAQATLNTNPRIIIVLKDNPDDPDTAALDYFFSSNPAEGTLEAGANELATQAFEFALGAAYREPGKWGKELADITTPLLTQLKLKKSPNQPLLCSIVKETIEAGIAKKAEHDASLCPSCTLL